MRANANDFDGGVNNSGKFGRWAFAEFCDVYEIQSDFEAKVETEFTKLVKTVLTTNGHE